MGNLVTGIAVGPTKIDASIRDLAINRAVANMMDETRRIDWWLVAGDEETPESEYPKLAAEIVDNFINAWNNAHEYRDVNIRTFGDKIIFVAGGDDNALYDNGAFAALTKSDELGILDLFGVE